MTILMLWNTHLSVFHAVDDEDENPLRRIEYNEKIRENRRVLWEETAYPRYSENR